MKLTKYQKDVVDSIQNLDSNLVINAYAGTGKTSTLKAIADAYPNHRFLYLAYNTSVKQEAEKKFPENVKVLTTHGLAYRWYVLKFNSRPNVSGNLKPFNIIQRYHVDYKTAFIVTKSLHLFFNSIDSDLPDCISLLCEKNKSDLHVLETAQKICKNVWNDMFDRRIPITHDFYLKLASLDNNIDFLFNNYDFILVDEAQDTNPVVYKILLNSHKPIIAVGDKHQKIYGFRNAMDIMSDLKYNHNAKVLYLPESFRFPQKIADLAYSVLKIKSDFNNNEPVLTGLGPKSNTDSKAIITRTNAGIIKVIANYVSKHISNFYTYRTPSEIFSLPCAINYKFRNIKPLFKIPESINKFVGAFHSEAEISHYASETGDIEAKRAIEIVEEYSDVLNDLYTVHLKTTRKKKGVCILTAHTSKGLEFGEVDLFDDWPDKDLHMNNESYKEEINLFYVAITRAIHTLKTNSTLRNLIKNDKLLEINCRQTPIEDLIF